MSQQWYSPDHLLVPLAHPFHCHLCLPLIPEDPQAQRFLLVPLAQLLRSVPVHPESNDKPIFVQQTKLVQFKRSRVRVRVKVRAAQCSGRVTHG